MNSPATLCPQFIRCSVNNCPLDSAYPNAFIHHADSEKSCPMEKNVRLRIAAQFPPSILNLSGLTRAEHAAKVAYEAKPVDAKMKLQNQGIAALNRPRN